jgi:hypothetical protein
MENILLLPESEIIAGKKIRSKMTGVFFSHERESVSTFIDCLISEGGETFFHYLNSLGHAYKCNMMLLSSRHNYCYDYSDLRGASMVINLKRMNRVPHMMSFLNTISKAVTEGAFFSGCFSEHSTPGSTFCSIPSHEISRDEMVGHLESTGLIVFDMTEIKGLTYFIAKKN